MLKKIQTTILVVIINCLLVLPLFSQVKITGSVNDKEGKPVEFAEILLLSKDSIPVKNQFSDEKGFFVLETKQGNYILQIKNFQGVFYNKQLQLTNNLDLGILKVENINKLSDFVVTAQKKLIERKVDRLVFNVENSISATGGDAIDALKVTPSIRVQNDQISMVGKSGMSLMVDDRLIQLSGDDLINFLKSIKSNDIKSIEVITTPPAKYEAEGNSGIVNIKLKKAKKDSFSGNIQPSYTQAKYALGSISGGLNYQKDKLTATSTISYDNGSTAPYQEYTLNYPKFTWFEINENRSFQNDLSGRATLDYQLTPETTVGMQYVGANSKPLRKGTNTSFITSIISNQLDSSIVTPSRMTSGKVTNNVSVYTITKLDTLGKKISFDADYFNLNDNSAYNFTSNIYLPGGKAKLDRLTAANTLDNRNIDIYTAKMDVEIPTKWVNLSFGAKLSTVKNESIIAYYNTVKQPPILDANRSNTFRYTENLQAVYISGSKNLSPQWDIQLGLRAENTQTKGFSATLNKTTENSYVKLFPTFYLSYKFGESSSLGLNYSRRINRPSYSNLNPFRTYTSAFNYGEGNPFLQPFFTDNVEFSHTYKNLYSSLYANYLTNGFDEVTFVSPTNSIQAVIPYNFYKQKTVGLLESYTFNGLEWLESNNTLSVSYAATTSELAGTVPKISAWTTFFNSNNSFVLNQKKTLKAELSFLYMSPSLAGSYQLSSFYFVDAGVKMYFLDKKLQLGINGLDIFRTNKSTFIQNVNGIKQANFDYPDSQKIRFTLTYNFGKSLEREDRKSSNEDEKERVR
jgi:Outer membrane protein beta-barrel family